MNTGSLRGKSAIITGAAQGLGAAIARAYAEAGMALVLLDIKVEPLATLAEQLSLAHNVPVLPMPADLSDPERTRTAAEGAVRELGAPHVLVHNAALLINRPLQAVSFDAWRREMSIIIDAAFVLTQVVWEPMTAAGGGRIVYVSSRSGVEGFLDESPYVAGKHALEGFMKCMAMEGEPRGIRANTITPGMLMHTPMSEITYDAEARKRWVDSYLLTPGFVWLAAEDSAHVTGQRLNAWEISEQVRAGTL